ncbi:hypothetical protein ALC57_02975 [Trachymyrmex cornetzi]|uniref:DUF8207 domain-containing protein n=1 Tax=Trachymyrmex cornetzi TaxID=471704 RepID=A0A151JMS2_9HYME|nr:hypothetical protein ALC57_02975 [Trachymyrmex cornetzi]
MADVREREKIAREIEKTSESIRKKHRALKTGRIEEDMALKRHVKPIIKPLRQIVDSPGVLTIKRQSRDNDAASAPKREKKEEVEEEKEGEEASETFERFATLRGDKQKSDYMYGVYLHKDGLMFGNKCFDVDDADNIIIDDVRYTGTPGLYELIFKRIPDDLLYTEDDMNKYKSMLLATNAHKHKHHSQGRLLSNRGYKYKHIIAPLMSMTPKKQSKKSGKGLPRAMTLNDNAIDYVHWDDPNELVDRL